METIAIIGLGLIGGSMGLDLVKCGYRVMGITRRLTTCQQALERQVVHVADTSLSLAQDADLVIVCTPISHILNTLEAVTPFLQDHAVVTDVGSVKGAIVSAATAYWPRFVGGHPMAGKATAGLEVAEPGLFKGCPYVLTPAEETIPEALQAVRQLVTDLNGHLLECSPYDHDQAVAWISHLPVMVSSSLIQACEQESEADVLALARALASSGFRDTSRVGGGVPELGSLMARYNRAALLQSLATYREQLNELTALIEAENWPVLETWLRQTQAARPAYLQGEQGIQE
jgi:arogenate dehydrogenase (NADP+)